MAQRLGDYIDGSNSRISQMKFSDAPVDIMALSEALDRLASIDPRASEVVKLRFFLGFNREQAADTLGVSVATADNDWAYAKGWLRVEMSESAQPEH